MTMIHRLVRTREGTQNRLVQWGRRQAEQYSHGHDMPLQGYLVMLGGYLGGVSALAALGRLTGTRIPDRVGPLDLALMGVATHRLSRTLAMVTLSAVATSDFLQYLYARLQQVD